MKISLCIDFFLFLILSLGPNPWFLLWQREKAKCIPYFCIIPQVLFTAVFFERIYYSGSLHLTSFLCTKSSSIRLLFPLPFEIVLFSHQWWFLFLFLLDFLLSFKTLEHSLLCNIASLLGFLNTMLFPHFHRCYFFFVSFTSFSSSIPHIGHNPRLLLFQVFAFSLGNLIKFQWYNYHLYDNESQIYYLFPDLLWLFDFYI